MKKIIGLILCTAVLCMFLGGCDRQKTAQNVNKTDKKYNIAVISGGNCDEEFESFFYGVYDEFSNIGYSVDKFAAGNDEDYLNQLFSDCLNGGYLGVVLYDLNEYAEEFSVKAKEAGVFVSVFSRVPYESENVAAVCYDQEKMTKISMDELFKLYNSGSSEGKTGVKVWYDNSSKANVEKSEAFDKYAQSKGFEVSVEIYEDSIDSGLSRVSKAKLDALPQDGFNYIWVSDDTMASLVAEYLMEQSIHNAQIVSVGLVQKNVGAMYEYRNSWKATSVVNYSEAGSACAEVLSKCIENKEFDKEITDIDEFVLKSEDLNEDSTIEIVEELSRKK